MLYIDEASCKDKVLYFLLWLVCVDFFDAVCIAVCSSPARFTHILFSFESHSTLFATVPNQY